MTEINWGSLFYELLWGSGAWLGFLIMALGCLFVVSKVKYSGFIFIPFWLLVALDYFFHINPSSNFTWLGILSLLMMIFCSITGVVGEDDD
jgi:hypothetical protein